MQEELHRQEESHNDRVGHDTWMIDDVLVVQAHPAGHVLRGGCVSRRMPLRISVASPPEPRPGLSICVSAHCQL